MELKEIVYAASFTDGSFRAVKKRGMPFRITNEMFTKLESMTDLFVEDEKHGEEKIVKALSRHGL